MYDKIIIRRPTVSKEEIGFLPGDLREKMDPWVQPIYQNFFATHRGGTFIRPGPRLEYLLRGRKFFTNHSR